MRTIFRFRVYGPGCRHQDVGPLQASLVVRLVQPASPAKAARATSRREHAAGVSCGGITFVWQCVVSGRAVPSESRRQRAPLAQESPRMCLALALVSRGQAGPFSHALPREVLHCTGRALGPTSSPGSRTNGVHRRSWHDDPSARLRVMTCPNLAVTALPGAWFVPPRFWSFLTGSFILQGRGHAVIISTALPGPPAMPLPPGLGGRESRDPSAP